MCQTAARSERCPDPRMTCNRFTSAAAGDSDSPHAGPLLQSDLFPKQMQKGRGECRKVERGGGSHSFTRQTLENVNTTPGL